jgi:hypothetical protein
LPFGKIVQAADQQAPEQQSRVIGWSSCQSFAFMEFVQLFGVIRPVDQIIGSVEGFGGCFSTETIALAPPRARFEACVIVMFRETLAVCGMLLVFHSES